MSHRRRQQEKRRYRQALSSHGYHHSYFSRVIVRENGHLLKFYPYSSNYNLKKYYKNLTNRKIRRANELLNGGSYKKIFDLWWNLY